MLVIYVCPVWTGGGRRHRSKPPPFPNPSKTAESKVECPVPLTTALSSRRLTASAVAGLRKRRTEELYELSGSSPQRKAAPAASDLRPVQSPARRGAPRATSAGDGGSFKNQHMRVVVGIGGRRAQGPSTSSQSWEDGDNYGVARRTAGVTLAGGGQSLQRNELASLVVGKTYPVWPPTAPRCGGGGAGRWRNPSDLGTP